MLQRSPDWYAARLGCVGASSVADVLATTKTGEAASRANLRARLVVERLTGVPAETYVNAAMQHGIDTEAEARAVYEAHMGVFVQEEGWAPHPSIPFSGCSPDGLVGDDGLVELKCPQAGAHLDMWLTGKVPTRYFQQVMWQMACTGRKWCDVASYQPLFPEGKRLWVKRVERDDERIAVMEEAVRVFLAEVAEVAEKLR